jgi:hypothetical protein
VYTFRELDTDRQMYHSKKDSTCIFQAMPNVRANLPSAPSFESTKERKIHLSSEPEVQSQFTIVIAEGEGVGIGFNCHH